MAGLLYKNQYKNKRGIALMEFLLGFFMFALIVALLYGSFGVVHSSILNSIAARTYAFAVIANQSNIRFSKGSESTEILGYFDRESRFFGITTYQDVKEPEWNVPTIAMDFIRHDSSSNNNPDDVVINPNSSGGLLGIVGNPKIRRRTEINQWTIDTQGQTVKEGDLLPDGQRHDRQTAIVRQKHGYGICLSASC